MRTSNPFVHSPRVGELKQAFIHPIHNKPLWNKVWNAARTQPWFGPEVGLVGGSTVTGRFYFARWGVPPFALVEIEPESASKSA